MDFIPQSCAATSIGAANGMFDLLFQTILAAYCAVSPPEKWPKDYGPTALKEGTGFRKKNFTIKIKLFFKTRFARL
jgi:hypothetical protein